MSKVIRSTKNYKIFIRSEDNRELDISKHGNLINSIKRYGFLSCYPIVCKRINGRLQVIDGQHRLVIAERQGEPVYYVEETVDFDVAEVNRGTTLWKIGDYMSLYIRNEDEHSECYRTGKEFAEEFSLPLGVSFALLAGTTTFTNIAHEFYTGNYRVKELEWATRVANLFSELRSINGKVVASTLIQACIACCHIPKFDEQRLISGARRKSELLRSSSTRDGYLELLDDLYNFGRQEHFGLKAAAINAMKKRNITNKKRDVEEEDEETDGELATSFVPEPTLFD